MFKFLLNPWVLVALTLFHSTSAQPENDVCVGSLPITLNVPVDGSNIGATGDFANQGVCGPRSDGRGVWYSVAGNGGLLTASICSLSTTEAVFLGVFNQCGSQDCNGWATSSTGTTIQDDSFAQCTNNDLATYSWLSTLNDTYYLHIRGFTDVNFRLVVTGESIIENDDCRDGMALELGSSIEGNTEGSTFDFLQPNTCGIGADLPGIWYRVIGTGDTYTVTLCSKTPDPMDFGVFDDCFTRSCNGHSNYAVAMCENDDSLVYTWNTEPGVNYYVHIRSPEALEFVLKLAAASTVENNVCREAIPLTLGVPTSGTNFGATFDFVDPDLCGPRSDLPAVWYVITGNGYKYKASICSKNDFSFFFGVFDDCDHRGCIGAPAPPDLGRVPSCTNPDDDEDDTGVYFFDTFIGANYYVQVRGEEGLNFDITVTQSGGGGSIRSVSIIALGVWILVPTILFALTGWLW